MQIDLRSFVMRFKPYANLTIYMSAKVSEGRKRRG